MAKATPDFILYAQHGWADTGRAIAVLADGLATPETHVIAPSLGYIQTWLRIEPLIRKLERLVIATLQTYPDTPMRIVGHSMGGLIWLELLDRHPEWMPQVHSLVLIASPIGGASWGRIFDPLNLGIGIARDLGRSRRAIAEKIAVHIPTLVIAGDIDDGSDGTIPIGSTRIRHTQFIRLPGLSHPTLRNHPLVRDTIQTFWAQEERRLEAISYPHLDAIIQQLQSLPEMVDAHQCDFTHTKPWITLTDGSTIRVWKNSLGIEHVFVASPTGECLYSGFTGWLHSKQLHQALAEIKRTCDQSNVEDGGVPLASNKILAP